MMLNFSSMKRPNEQHKTVAESLSCESLAHHFKACGDPLRLEILTILGRDAYGVLELAAIFSLKQSAMSHHLKVLANAGLVETQREGNSIFYRRPLLNNAGDLIAAKLSLFTLLDQIPVSALCQQGIEKVRKQRADQSAIFFEKNAKQFKKHQELIADFNLYAEPMAELIRQKLPVENHCALEIGPGEGGFLVTLAKLFTRVIAVDNSEVMLEKTKQTVSQHELENVGFVLGTSTDIIASKQKFDAVVMNMVLHHVPSPASLIQDCAALLRPGGTLFISELNKHHQSWARENCGDVWLGFEAGEISHWTQEAELYEGDSIFIGVRNGFQIQLRHFFKSPVKSLNSDGEPGTSVYSVPTSKLSLATD